MFRGKELFDNSRIEAIHEGHDAQGLAWAVIEGILRQIFVSLLKPSRNELSLFVTAGA
jgi:hypothetical protein